MSTTRPIYPEPQVFPEVPPAAAEPPPLPHVEHSYSPAKFVCVRCGSDNIGQGTLVDFTGTKFENVRFAPKRITLRFLNSLRALTPFRSLLPIAAEVCRDCGAILLTVDPDELRQRERRR